VRFTNEGTRHNRRHAGVALLGLHVLVLLGVRAVFLVPVPAMLVMMVMAV